MTQERENQLREIFDVFDVDNSGSISAPELGKDRILGDRHPISRLC
jgi:Ca2+-binding EF-hand superfamily protein